MPSPFRIRTASVRDACGAAGDLSPLRRGVDGVLRNRGARASKSSSAGSTRPCVAGRGWWRKPTGRPVGYAYGSSAPRPRAPTAIPSRPPPTSTRTIVAGAMARALYSRLCDGRSATAASAGAYAGVALPNEASICLSSPLWAFSPIGVFPRVGRKFGGLARRRVAVPAPRRRGRALADGRTRAGGMLATLSPEPRSIPRGKRASRPVVDLLDSSTTCYRRFAP